MGFGNYDEEYIYLRRASGLSSIDVEFEATQKSHLLATLVTRIHFGSSGEALIESQG